MEKCLYHPGFVIRNEDGIGFVIRNFTVRPQRLPTPHFKCARRVPFCISKQGAARKCYITKQLSPAFQNQPINIIARPLGKSSHRL